MRSREGKRSQFIGLAEMRQKIYKIPMISHCSLKVRSGVVGIGISLHTSRRNSSGSALNASSVLGHQRAVAA
jgi:hypothetical protein